MRFRFVPFLVANSLCAFAAPAAAGSDARTSTGRELGGSGATYEVAFDDDPLDALGSATHLFHLKVRKLPERMLLIRPRVTFVPHMLKSVEQM
jgi:hypothetical protein